jgi:ubiquinone/menaquinone biosynthesis C-methylase UbiE
MGWRKKRQIMQRYDITAGIYDARYAEEQRAKIEAALKHVSIMSDDEVLDVGCGSGLLSDYIADRVRRIIALDISKRTLLEAKRRTKRFKNAELLLADADNLPLREKQFTRIFVLTVIQNLPNPVEMLNEARRAARNGCVFIVTGLKRVFSREAFKTLLHEAGMKVIAWEDEERLKCYVAVAQVGYLYS